MPHRAFTMGIGTILDARKIVMLVTGESKSDIIAQAIEGPVSSMVTAQNTMVPWYSSVWKPAKEMQE